jgi:hypothetical protein
MIDSKTQDRLKIWLDIWWIRGFLIVLFIVMAPIYWVLFGILRPRKALTYLLGLVVIVRGERFSLSIVPVYKGCGYNLMLTRSSVRKDLREKRLIWRRYRSSSSKVLRIELPRKRNEGNQEEN